ncbi:hypothetical protein HPB52_008934 [Rhipicephalus sanguineus]|uniref:Tick transposon n=1 Tax=Rhipicephalus sanguineus TaxID=34632 RepID=A0A9D4T410_RHISA|nr:hypothetical protein HPB52_008934 [Rhipicephalus sanguineus]
MLGFHPHLSTQDAPLQLHHDLLDPPIFSDTEVLLSLGLEKALDHVSHLAILAELDALNPGTCTYNYIGVFLTARTAEIIIGDLPSPTYKLGPRGTPQGAVFLSSARFLACWTSRRALTATSSRRCNARTDVVTSHAYAADLTCSAAKFAVLLKRPPSRRRYKSPQPTFTVHANSAPVPSFRTSHHGRHRSKTLSRRGGGGGHRFGCDLGGRSASYSMTPDKLSPISREVPSRLLSYDSSARYCCKTTSATLN